MAERLREMKFTGYIDTNKETYRGEFETIQGLIEWYNGFDELHGEIILQPRNEADEE